MDKPKVIRTIKPLPFGSLSPDDFERLSLRLIELEGYQRPQHLGAGGNDDGRDIVALKSTTRGEETWYFQCKRYARVKTTTFLTEIDKYTHLAQLDPTKLPQGIVFITNAVVSAHMRDIVSDYCRKRNFQCEFWASTELDMRVKKHPEIIEEFFFEDRAPVLLIPHQLPPSLRDFTGRKEELEELSKRFVEDNVMIFGFHGLGGIGKTALALKFANEVATHFPDGQFYMDLKGTSSEPLTESEIIGHVIRGFQSTVKLPESPQDLRGAYHSALYGRRVLLFLDNAASRQQIQQLIPSKNCALIFTSRSHFTVPGLFIKHVTALKEAEACDLLSRIAPRIGDFAKTVAQLCACLPLALRLSASVIAERVDLDPKDYVKQLEDEQHRLKLVDASIALSYSLLDSETQRLWRTLSIISDSFDSFAAGAVWSIDSGVQEKLSALVASNLLEWNSTTGRYYFHDLVKLYAQSQVTKREQYIGQKLNAVHYMVIAARAEGLYERGGDFLSQGVALFDLEWTNIQGGQLWATNHSEHDDEAALVCSGYADAAANLFTLRQAPAKRIYFWTAALNAARRLGDRAAEGTHLGALGAHYYQSKQLQEAISYFEQYLSIATEINDRVGEASMLCNLGFAKADLGEYNRAINYFNSALNIAHKISNLRIQSMALGGIGKVNHSSGEQQKSIKFYKQALLISRKIGDLPSEGHWMNSIGVAFAALKKERKALKYYKRYFDISVKIGDKGGQVLALRNSGRIYISLNQLHRAIKTWTDLLAISRELEDRDSEIESLNSLGVARAKSKQHQDAANLFEQAIKLARQIKDQHSEGLALYNSSLAFNELGNRRQALTNAKAALRIYKKVKEPRIAEVQATLEEWQLRN